MERLTEREVAAIALTGLLQARDTLCLRLACATGVIATCELTPLLDESALSDERLLALTLGLVKLIGSEANADRVGAAFQVSPERAQKVLDFIAGIVAEALDSDSPLYAAVVQKIQDISAERAAQASLDRIDAIRRGENV